jgi:hypothetical protein
VYFIVVTIQYCLSGVVTTAQHQILSLQARMAKLVVALLSHKRGVGYILLARIRDDGKEGTSPHIMMETF